jgi:hypothetical protein
MVRKNMRAIYSPILDLVWSSARVLEQGIDLADADQFFVAVDDIATLSYHFPTFFLLIS